LSHVHIADAFITKVAPMTDVQRVRVRLVRELTA